jgi:hypothetical protein
MYSYRQELWQNIFYVNRSMHGKISGACKETWRSIWGMLRDMAEHLGHEKRHGRTFGTEKRHGRTFGT